MANYFHGTPNVENLFSFWLKIFRSEALPGADMSADPLVWVGHLSEAFDLGFPVS
jgi:hypothetical protein